MRVCGLTLTDTVLPLSLSTTTGLEWEGIDSDMRIDWENKVEWWSSRFWYLGAQIYYPSDLIKMFSCQWMLRFIPDGPNQKSWFM